MIRSVLISSLLQQIYGKKPTDDAAISKNLVNVYINEAIAECVKNSWKENVQLEGVSFVSNSFFSTFKDLTITSEGVRFGYYSCTLPTVPPALGRNEGIATVQLLNDKRLSVPLIMTDVSNIEYWDRLPKPKGTPYYNTGSTLYFKSPTLNINGYKAVVTMVSGGDATDLNSQLNIPDEWIRFVRTYVRDMLLAQRKVPTDVTNDGVDN